MLSAGLTGYFLQSVFPLNEKCGIIEWIPNLSGFRNVVFEIYKDAGIPTQFNPLLRKLSKGKLDPLLRINWDHCFDSNNIPVCRR